ncbi:hypothetical protein [Streptomyces chartreusis]|uniref:hypothetical protein n=1 Tax=Streptomyces chartreusis TaxID=1969 RepID=UPI003654A980
MDASHYLAEIRKALTSRDGISKPRPEQLEAADVYANAATAHALDRIATALETLAADVAVDGINLQPAIRHSH